MKKKLKNSAFLPVACICMASTMAHAQTELPQTRLPQSQNVETGDALQFRVGAGLERDSNVLRAPTAESDTVGILSAGARFDKQYSLQRVVLDAELARYNYSDFSGLDYTTLNYEGAFHYAITPRFRGVLRATQRESRDIDTATTGVTESFKRTERTQMVEGIYAPGGGLLGLAGLSHTSSESDAVRSLESSPSITSLRLGVGYELRSGSQVVLEYRRGDGKYDNINADFTEDEIAAVGRWEVTPKTTLTGRLGYLQRDHDSAASGLDFSGLVANLGVDWEVTGKTSVQAGFERDLGSYEFAGGGNVKALRTYIQPVWRATAKTAVRLRYQHEARDWQTVSAAAPDAGREDSLNAYGVYVDWEPRRNLFVTGSLRQERRDSNINAFDYRANIVGVGARFVF